MPQIDFYVTQAPDATAWLKLACRVTEKAYLAGRRVFVWSSDAAVLTRFDELLWTFADGSFVPHDLVKNPAGTHDVPVLLSSDAPDGDLDVLVNLDRGIPAFVDRAARVAEFIDADPARREAGRTRFRGYRDRGLAPATHQVSASGSL